MGAVFLQGAGAESAVAALSVSVAFPNDVRAGNLLIVGCTSGSTDIPSNAVTDSLSNTYSQAVFRNGGHPVAIHYCISGSDGPCTVTFDCGTDQMALAVAEFSGAPSTAVVDDSATATDNANPANATSTLNKLGIQIGVVSSSAVTPQSLTTNSAGKEVYKFEGTGAASLTFGMQYRIHPGPGAIPLLWTISGVNPVWYVCVASFEADRPNPVFPNYIDFPKNLLVGGV